MVNLAKKSQTENKAEFLPNALRIASLAADYKALDLRAYDIRGLTLVADCFILCSASSTPQFKAITKGVMEGMKEIGVRPLHAEGELTGGWMVIDYGVILFHVFRKAAREFYDLDGLWGDAPQIDLDLDE